MKSLTANIIWAIATLGSMAIVGCAGYYAAHSTGREQSGYDMILFVALAIMLTLFDLNDTRGGEWLPKAVGLLSILFAIVFGIHYFGGDGALKALLTWSW